jgi:ribose 5-phosphate isomerase B
MDQKTIVIGCDDAGFELKAAIVDVIRSKGYIVIDEGINSIDDNTYYPSIAERVCKKIIDSNYSNQGILICGTGIGMAITANKFPGIFAAVCHDLYSTERSKLSNNCNVLCMGARVIGLEVAKRMVCEWLLLDFIDGSSTPKVAEMRRIDVQNR